MERKGRYVSEAEIYPHRFERMTKDQLIDNPPREVFIPYCETCNQLPWDCGCPRDEDESDDEGDET